MSWQKTIDYVSQNCVAGHLRILNRVVTNIYDDAFRPLGLKVSQANILIIVAQQGVTRPADVCERLQLGASTLSRNVERMRAKGWLEIVPGEDARTQSFSVDGRKEKSVLEQAYPLWQRSPAAGGGNPGQGRNHSFEQDGQQAALGGRESLTWCFFSPNSCICT